MACYKMIILRHCRCFVQPNVFCWVLTVPFIHSLMAPKWWWPSRGFSSINATRVIKPNFIIHVKLTTAEFVRRCEYLLTPASRQQYRGSQNATIRILFQLKEHSGCCCCCRHKVPSSPASSLLLCFFGCLIEISHGEIGRILLARTAHTLVIENCRLSCQKLRVNVFFRLTWCLASRVIFSMGIVNFSQPREECEWEFCFRSLSLFKRVVADESLKSKQVVDRISKN
jgi:hypothetical protein